jgi:hypothetical protein
VQIAEIFLEFAKLAWVDARWDVVDGESELRLFLLQFGFEDLPCAGNGIALVVEEGFDAKSHFDVATAIKTLASATFMRFELGKLALPEAQDVCRDVAEFGDVANAEIELVRNV